MVKKTYAEAKEFLKPLGIIGVSGWREYCESGDKPQDIPTNASSYYRDEWRGFPDFLSHEIVSRRHKYRPFKEARKFVRSLNLKSNSEWTNYYKNNELPEDIPKVPKNAYQDEGYISIGDWLGTGRIADHLKEYISYNEAKKIVHSLKIRNWREWKVFCKSAKKPNNIPNSPANVYKDKGWVSAADWFGKE